MKSDSYFLMKEFKDYRLDILITVLDLSLIILIFIFNGDLYVTFGIIYSFSVFNLGRLD